jgi:hypothetical protein
VTAKTAAPATTADQTMAISPSEACEDRPLEDEVGADAEGGEHRERQAAAAGTVAPRAEGPAPLRGSTVTTKT